MEKYLKYKIKYLKLKQFGSKISDAERERQRKRAAARREEIKAERESIKEEARQYIFQHYTELEGEKFTDILKSLMDSLSRYNFITQILDKKYDPLPNIFLETKYKENGLDITKVCSFTQKHFLLSSPICDKISKILNEYFYKYNKYYYLDDVISVLVDGDLTLTRDWEHKYIWYGDNETITGTVSYPYKNSNFIVKFHKLISSESYRDWILKEFEKNKEDTTNINKGKYEFIVKSSSDSNSFKSMIKDYQEKLEIYFNLIFSYLDSLFTYLKGCNCNGYIDLDLDFKSIISKYRPNDIDLFNFKKKKSIVEKYKITL